MHHRSVAMASLSVLMMSASPLAAPERFENHTAGISLERPDGWSTASLQQVEENRRRVRLSDKEMEKAMRSLATAPLFVFTRHPEPHPDLNPSIQVMLRPMGSLSDSSATGILKAMVGPLQKSFEDFRFDKGIHETTVAGLKGAHMRARYTVRNDAGQEFKTLSRLWVIPRGGHMFLIGMSGPQTGPDLSEKEFAQALASIRIEP